MRQKVNFYQVDGQPMLAPDAEPEFSFSDLDAGDTGRDESGVMHRVMIREKVGRWSFSYAWLTDEELSYLRGLFAGKSQFTFTHPAFGDSDATETCIAYMSQYSAVWKNRSTGLWRNFKFNIIQC